ncbi:hypothetical protein J0B03_00190 [Alkalibacter rhizosphaerae]|uniref:Sulfate transporter n=1 Tax=Alkalibacter rhizosphaerae TaxID=2815577 RepID=A0A974XEU0_9FIRM|nr:putative sulfate/molybdate transporter [Alkalibacter rhizosphaerae]QSX08549.1 hypothetical protein J0B03_00190 [Alkalibacter rhizosphaerae]
MREKDFRFTLDETAGALGDFGTLLPIVVGVSVATDMDLSRMLFFFGLAYIGTGLYYKLPMPVEPMKAMGVVAIAERLSPGEIAGAGIVMGVVLLLIAVTGAMDLIKKNIPIPLIRGIQLGLALTLMRQALIMVGEDWILGLISIFIVLFYTLSKKLDISALVIIVLGVAVGVFRHGSPGISIMTLPSFQWPLWGETLVGITKATIPQIPLTLGNAVLATALLISDLLDRKVEEKKLLLSMSSMLLLAVPFGGFPMCHGAGGLAAQYRFGARTGGSNLISGAVLLLVAFFFATPKLELIIPFGALGALLFYSALSLYKTSRKTTENWFTIVTGVIAFVFGMTWAFLGMWGFHFVRTWIQKKRV